MEHGKSEKLVEIRGSLHCQRSVLRSRTETKCSQLDLLTPWVETLWMLEIVRRKKADWKKKHSLNMRVLVQ